MYTIIIAVIVYAAFLATLPARYRKIQAKRSYSESFMSAMFIHLFLGFVVVAFAAAMLAGTIGRSLPFVYNTSAPETLVGLKNTETTNGTFIWGTGSINNSMVYRVYIKNADGSMSPRTIPADENVRIIEDESLHNTGSWTTTYRTRDGNAPGASWVFIPFHITVDKVELRVPKGTVSQTFEANR